MTLHIEIWTEDIEIWTEDIEIWTENFAKNKFVYFQVIS